MAGTGFGGFSGDSGPATQARLNFPIGVTVDSAGTLFIADWRNQRIRRVEFNQMPIANAGPDQTVNEGTLVVLDGSGSHDPDAAPTPLSYQWTQVAGPGVTLNLSDPVHPTFTAPNVPRDGRTLTFQLTVSDGALVSDPDTVDVTVKDVNHPPVADAGPDQTVQEGSLVTLDGRVGSYDPDGDPITYSWTQTGGQAVSLSGAATATPSFTAPQVGPAGVTLTFTLTVDDGLATGTDTVIIHVENVNHPPVTDAGPDQTWNEGAVVILNGTGSSDPDADPLTYQWTQVSGPPVTLSNPAIAAPTFTAPQVGHGGATMVFQLVVVDDSGAASAADQVFIVILDDGYSGHCTGAVTVCAPHDRQTDTCIDSGQRYNSLLP